jgi:predicted acetyltransferase
MFRHDLSEFRSVLPFPDGTFRCERLNAAFAEPDWVSYLLTSGDQPAGFALVRGLTGATRVLSAFFIVRGARRHGLGMRMAIDVINTHPGPWEIAFQDENEAAARFWPRVATKIAGDNWAVEQRAVPNQPELPPDTWISIASATAPEPTSVKN